jgi:hypothetical protein
MSQLSTTQRSAERFRRYCEREFPDSAERVLIDAILAEYADELDKAACDRCEQCSPIVMCSFHSVLSMLQGHTVPSALLVRQVSVMSERKDRG